MTPFYLIVIGCVCIATALLLIPLGLVFRVEYVDPRQGPRAQGELRFFAGLFGVRLHLSSQRQQLTPHICGWNIPLPRSSTGTRAPRKKRQDIPSPTPPGLPKRPRRSARTGAYDRLFFWLQFAGPAVWDSIRRAPGILRLKHLDLTGSFGFADPIQTGYAYGYLQALGPLVDRRWSVNLTPDFTVARLSGHLRLAIHLYIGYFVYILCRFALQVGYRWLLAAWSARRAKSRTIA